MLFRSAIARIAMAALAAAVSLPCHATILSTVRGVVHDPQHFPIQDAQVSLKAAGSSLEFKAVSSSDGVFQIASVPLGVYRVHVEAKGFAETDETVTVLSGTNPVIHVVLQPAGVKTTVTVSASEQAPDTVTPTTLVTRSDIEETPGANRTLGTEMITDYVPGAYMTHDMLHMRGGHQTSWLIDGISIPNTKIASNVGPQIDPKDIDQLEIERGSYGSDIGDRTYGVFNVLPRSGFEFNRDGELTVMGGNFYTGEAQLSLGDHSERTAWYASVTGSRSHYGLAPPVAGVYHDATNSQSGFANITHNQTDKDQLRLDGQFRRDYFQVPYDPNPDDYETTSGYYSSVGLRDVQAEHDGFVIANWVHTFSPKSLFECAPFYHYNVSNYDSNPNDQPVATTWHQTSNYVGGQGDLHAQVGWNDFSTGFYSFYQRENDLFGVQVNDGSAPSEPNAPGGASAALFECYVADHLRLGHYITLLGGERLSVFDGGYSETAIYPRIGATVIIPRLRWVLRGFYGHFFQPAPLLTISSSVLNYASDLGGGENTFTPLRSERDEEHQFGIMIPYRGWSLDVDTFKTRINNFLDHSNLGESNMYFPISVDGALVRGWELAIRSPRLGHIGQFHLTYSNQIAEQRGNIIGGFVCSLPNAPACDLGSEYSPVDHDQRDTLNTGFTTSLPWHTWFASNVYYGSGFVNGLAGADEGPYNGNYLPAHTTFDVSAGHTFGEQLKVAVNVLNVTDHRVLLDNSVTIGGFHYNDPRMIQGQITYRFHF
ncbi:carboxypeptidase regulatory-like domain-containing protein [Acidicapsa dinghuensis]|uniref:Carboxypeptidase regulatory-like domain-containing protein n=1 Tax=Acidicapsa dinghuensis TaxID=2218256 RepID=A0ABW1EGK9_9BACT|nr:TonB-dependent receptor [Acidicapsa dinghuensis]